MAFGRKKRPSTAGTRVFFCTDLHGSDVCFKKFVNAADFYGTQILIMGGDVTGKMVVPIAKQPTGVYLTSFAGEELEFTSEDEVASFKKQLANMGFYPAAMDEEEFRVIKASQDEQDRLFRELIRERARAVDRVRRGQARRAPAYRFSPLPETTTSSKWTSC